VQRFMRFCCSPGDLIGAVLGKNRPDQDAGFGQGFGGGLSVERRLASRWPQKPLQGRQRRASFSAGPGNRQAGDSGGTKTTIYSKLGNRPAGESGAMVFMQVYVQHIASFDCQGNPKGLLLAFVVELGRGKGVTQGLGGMAGQITTHRLHGGALGKVNSSGVIMTGRSHFRRRIGGPRSTPCGSTCASAQS
jgi:hypothetical protein